MNDELKPEFQQYRRTNVAEMRPYVKGEDLTGVSVSDVDDPPNDMGMVARNPKNHADQWYVARKYFEENFEPLNTRTPSEPVAWRIKRTDDALGKDYAGRQKITSWVYLESWTDVAERIKGNREQWIIEPLFPRPDTEARRLLKAWRKYRSDDDPDSELERQTDAFLAKDQPQGEK